MGTAVIIARDQKYGSRCQSVFREAGLFPVVVETVHRALALLGQFRPNVVVLERATSNGTGEGEELLAQAAAGTPLLTYTELPPPPVLVAVIRQTLGGTGNRSSI
jgi:hypothetical protein